jgi:hypothetical protein
MGLLVMIIAAILVAVGLAIVIVKYLPLKLRSVVSIVLLLATIFLGYKIYDGIMKPINFNINKKVKYAKVIAQLKIIRDAQVAHYDVTSNYTANKTGLIQFIDTAKFAITETKTIVETVNKGTKWNPINVEVEKKVIDTIGYEPVLKSFAGKDYINMFKVPGGDGKEFDLEIGKVEKVQGLFVPTFQAKTDKASILKGMDISLVKREMEAVESVEIKGADVSVGSLEEVSTGGNWPPFYDKNENIQKDKK